MEETITHHICYIPEIRIEVARKWITELHQKNEKNREKREMLFSAIKRWVYLSWVLQTQVPKDIPEAYDRLALWSEIESIKKCIIPDIIHPYKIVYITWELELQTGRLIQFDKDKKPLELDFSISQPAKLSLI